MTTDVFADLELHQRVAIFYAQETALLDDSRLDEWVALFTDDARYTMASPESRPAASAPADGDELPPFLLFNDDYQSLQLRVARLATGLAPGENPPTVTQRLVSDVLVTEDAGEEVRVRSSVLLCQVRHQRHEDLLVGRRYDVLRRAGDGFQIAARKVVLVHSVLPRTISVFF